MIALLLLGLIDVRLTTPTNGATVKGIVTVSASVTSTNPVQRVEFYRDGVLFKTIYPPQPGRSMKATIL